MKRRPDEIEIKMTNPCSERFDSFKRTSNGGFCQNCQKEVIDFEHYSDRELFDFFAKSTGRVCGKFKPHQLKTLYPTPETKPRNNRPVLWAFLGLALGINDAKAQNQNALEKPNIEIRETKNGVISRISKSKNIFISGKVVNENEEGLPGVNVVIKGTIKGVVTDLEGDFQIELKSEADSILVFSCVGFQDKEIIISKKTEIQGLEIKLKLDEKALSEVVIVGGACGFHKWYTPRGLWYKIKNIFR